MSTKPPPPPMRAPPPAKAPPPTVGSAPISVDQFKVRTGLVDGPQLIVVYGGGGIGKSTLAGLIPGNNLFLDVERGTSDLDVARIDSIRTFEELRAVLQSSIVDPFNTVIVDSGTKVEELSGKYVLRTVRHEKTHQLVAELCDFGWGAGMGHVYDAYQLFLADLDRLREKGKNVVLICHECISEAPNPLGENFIRYEPDLQSPKSGKNSIRNRVFRWADHVLFIGYDVISKDGKGVGGGTRTIFPSERPDKLAKSRRVSDPVPFTSPTDDTIWRMIFAQKEGAS